MTRAADATTVNGPTADTEDEEMYMFMPVYSGEAVPAGVPANMSEFIGKTWGMLQTLKKFRVFDDVEIAVPVCEVRGAACYEHGRCLHWLTTD